MKSQNETTLAELLPEALKATLDGALADATLEDVLDLARRLVEVSQSKGGPVRHRWQDAVIAAATPRHAHVLDLGCGSGELLGRLIRDKDVLGQGVELHPDAVVSCIEKGIPVFQADLDEGLTGFPENSFDYVILEETVQTLHQPLQVLREMLRVGRRCWVSFPNFGCWNVRLRLALNGRMPVTDELPYEWYDTPNIHLLTLTDFRTWADKVGVTILEGHVFAEGCVRAVDWQADNLLAEEALLLIEKGG